MQYRNYRGKDGDHSDYDHEEMANTLMEAEAIKADRGVMKHVHKKLKERGKAIDSIAKLRELGKLTGKEENDGNDPSTKSPTRRNIESVDRDDPA